MKNHYKFWIVLSFLVVFAAGLVSGVILEKNILNPKPKRPSRDARHGDRPHFPTINELEEALNLNADQQDRMLAVFQQNEERIKQMRKEIYTQYRTLRWRISRPCSIRSRSNSSMPYSKNISRSDAQRRRGGSSTLPRPKRRKEDRGESP